jgi:hypothetical protein
MKKVKKIKIDELRAEYDVKLFRGGTRGKYAPRFRQGTNLVLLEPDVAAAFPTPAAVNEALRMLINVAHQASSKTRT